MQVSIMHAEFPAYRRAPQKIISATRALLLYTTPRPPAAPYGQISSTTIINTNQMRNFHRRRRRRSRMARASNRFSHGQIHLNES